MKKLVSLILAAALFSSMAFGASAALEVMPGGDAFDPEYYAQQNPDVVAAVGTDTSALYRHYTQSGKEEGRKAYDEAVYDAETVKKFRMQNFQRSDNKPIEILQVLYTVNSVGGVSPIILWNNNTGKTIKYITFYLSPYNAVDDPVADEVTGKKTFACKVTGPIDSEKGIGKYYYNSFEGVEYVFRDSEGIPYYYQGAPLYRTYAASKYQTYDRVELNYPSLTFSQISRWDVVWYNNTTRDIRFSKVEIDYMDGTHQTLSNVGAPLCNKVSYWQSAS